MNKFSFRSWLTEYGDLFWEGIRDISALPMDKVKLLPIWDYENWRSNQREDFEAEPFSRDSAWDSCQDELYGEFADLSDYTDEPIYDDLDDDADFDTPNTDAWTEENPEPEKESFNTDEEYTAALEKWQEEYDEVDEEYTDAVRKWEREMENRKENAEEALQKATRDCVDEQEREHNQEQEARRKRHEEENSHSNPENAENAGYNSTFTVGQDHFKVGMDRQDIEYQSITLSGVFGVTFSGPAGYSLTNKNTGGEAMQKYNHLLASVAKMVQEEKNKGRIVNGFTFYPAAPAMGLMYQKFYTNYLKPAGYMRVSPELYLRKDYIRELMDEIPDKKYAYSKIINTGREVRADLGKVRAEKSIIRTAKTMLPKLVGNLIMFKKPWKWDSNAPTDSSGRIVAQEPIAGLVIKTTNSADRFNEPEATVVADVADQHGLLTHHVSFRNIFNIVPDPADPKGILKKLYPIGTPTPDMVIPLLRAVVQDPNLLASIDGMHFRKMLAQYGIQPQMTTQPQVYSQLSLQRSPSD